MFTIIDDSRLIKLLYLSEIQKVPLHVHMSSLVPSCGIQKFDLQKVLSPWHMHVLVPLCCVFWASVAYFRFSFVLFVLQAWDDARGSSSRVKNRFTPDRERDRELMQSRNQTLLQMSAEDNGQLGFGDEAGLEAQLKGEVSSPAIVSPDCHYHLCHKRKRQECTSGSRLVASS